MTENPFRALRALGYQNILPVIPPGVELDVNTYLWDRLKAGKDHRGKAPGEIWSSGKWGGLKGWETIVATEAQLDYWHSIGASVGLRTGDGVLVIDIDSHEPEVAEALEADAVATLGPSPSRVGLLPKRALVYAIEGSMPYQALSYDRAGQEGVEPKDRIKDQIEFMAGGKQMVMFGIHQKSGKPYRWVRPLLPFDQLTKVSADAIEALKARWEEMLPSGKLSGSMDKSEAPPDQSELMGDLISVTKAMKSLPNTKALYPTYRDMITVGEALHAATAEDRALGEELWHEWCEKWEGGDYDYDVSEKVWSTFNHEHKIGAAYLYGQALKHGKGFDRAHEWHITEGVEMEPPPPPEPSPLFDVSMSQQDESNDTFPLLTLDEIMSREPPAFLVARHIPQVSVGFLYSTPGAGKSFLALDVALSLSCAFGEWHGDALAPADEDAVVLYIAAEGSFGFRNRVKAWCQVREQKSLPNRFLMIEKTIDFMSAEDIDKLLRTVRGAGRRPCLVIIDTVSRAMPGADENLQKEMTLFVRACDKIKEDFGCAVLGVHHAGKNGDMRGSTVLLGAGDFVFKLERKTGSTIGRLTCEKQKDAPDGWTEPYRFETVDIGEGQTSLVPSRAEVSDAPEVVLNPSTTKEVLKAIEDAWNAGEPWGRTHHAKERFFERRMVQDFAFSAEQAADILALWIQSGVIEEAIADKKSKRKGLRVCGAWEPAEEGGVFD